ncbi:MAG: excisionase family DNA-binding protein [Bacteriovoracaceae bacterium]|jgi:excisionase family DNA binding protein|nr:excisionase family DNA-binding protein [Bacteriovoracaceae bacterium]
MKLSYDKDADAMTISFCDELIVEDRELEKNIFAGYSSKNKLVELQLLDISSSDDTWLTVEMAAKVLDKSTRTILRYIQDGTIKAKKVGKEYRIYPQSISEFAS